MLAFHDVRRAYTLPAYSPELQTDQSTHDAMLEIVQNRNVLDALRQIGCMKKDDKKTERLSLAKAASLTELVVVTVLRTGFTEKFTSGAVRCTCILYQKSGQCPHEIAVRALEGELSVKDLKEFTRKKRSASASETSRAIFVWGKTTSCAQGVVHPGSHRVEKRGETRKAEKGCCKVQACFTCRESEAQCCDQA